MRTSDRIAVGIIGCGNVASDHVPQLLNIPEVTIKYVADTSLPRASALAKGLGIPGIEVGDDTSSLPDCDIVLLTTPVGSRKAYVNEFASRGTFIFAEKPFALDEQNHLGFLRLSRKISCNYSRVLNSSIQQVREIVSSKLFGQLRKITITEGGIIGATRKQHDHYQTDSSLSGGGILIERGCHTLSQQTYILDAFDLSTEDAEIQQYRGLDVDVIANLKASGETDVPIHYHLSTVRPLKNLSTWVFETAVVTFDQTDAAAVLQISSLSGSADFALEPSRNFALSREQAFHLKWMHVLKLQRSETEFDAAKETSLNTTILIDDIYRKAGRE